MSDYCIRCGIPHSTTGCLRDDSADNLAWRNHIVDWHMHHPEHDCDCKDDTPDHKLCPSSVAHADARAAERNIAGLDGPPDHWDHDMWVAAWGHNAPLIASDMDYRIPNPPPGMSWLVTRMLVRGRKIVEVALIRKEGAVTVGTARTMPDSELVADTARRLARKVLS